MCAGLMSGGGCRDGSPGGGDESIHSANHSPAYMCVQPLSNVYIGYIVRYGMVRQYVHGLYRPDVLYSMFHSWLKMINNNNNCEDGWTKSSKVVRQSIAEQCSSNNSSNEPHATLPKVEIVIIVLKVVTYMQLLPKQW